MQAMANQHDTYPKPTLLKELTGNPGMRKLPIQLAIPKKLTTPPSYLNTERKKIFNHLLSCLPDKFLSEADIAICEVYAHSLCIYRIAAIHVQKNGLMIETLKGDLKENPHIHIMQKMAQNLKECMNSLGLSPIARAKIGAIMRHNKDLDSALKKDVIDEILD